MSTPFLQAYAYAIVTKLIERELLEVVEGREHDVMRFVAAYMAERRNNKSVISLTAQALLASPDVEEIFADDEELKDAVDALAQ